MAGTLQRSAGQRREIAAGPAGDPYRRRVEDVVERLRAVRVVPVMAPDDPEQAEAACRALERGGLPCVEIAFRTPAAEEALRRVAARGDGMLVGAGTVLTVEQVEAAAKAGARFAVSPALNDDVVAACRELGLPFFPGVATPTEVDRACTLGLRTVKVFPVEQLGGLSFLRAIAAAYRDVGFLPTGGVTRDTLAAYLSEPSVVACGGSWILKRAVLQQGRFDEIELLAREAVEIAR